MKIKNNDTPMEFFRKSLPGKTADVSQSVETPAYPDADKLRKAAKLVFLIIDQDAAQDLADTFNDAADMIEELQDFAIWMTGCGYDFCQHDYFCKKRDELLKS